MREALVKHLSATENPPKTTSRIRLCRTGLDFPHESLRRGLKLQLFFDAVFYLYFFWDHDFAAVSGSPGRGSVRDHEPRQRQGHHLHQDICGGPAVPHRRRVSAEIFREFRGHRRGGGDHRQADWQVPRIRLRDHGGQSGSRAGVQRRQPHHRRQESQCKPGLLRSQTSQHTDCSLCWSSASPAVLGSEAVRADPAVRHPSNFPPAQSGSAVPAGSSSGSTGLPLPGLQLCLQPLHPHWTGAVHLHPLTITFWWLPRLQLLPRMRSARSDHVANPPDCPPSSSCCSDHCVGHATTRLLPLPSPLPRSPAVIDESKQRDLLTCGIIKMRQDKEISSKGLRRQHCFLCWSTPRSTGFSVFDVNVLWSSCSTVTAGSVVTHGHEETICLT